MMIKREWRQLLEMIKFSLGKGKAPELRVEDTGNANDKTWKV